MSVIPAVISCEELNKLLKSSNNSIVVLEADAGKSAENDFKAGHIPNARYFEQLECTTPTEFLPRGLPDANGFAEYLTKLGVSNDDHVVLYDRSPAGFFAAGRAWVILKAYGVSHLSILNGGFNAWKNEIKEIETTETTVQAKKKFVVQVNQNMFRSYEQMLENFSGGKDAEPKVQTVDARPPNLFYGADAGHMPGAIHLPHGSMIDQTTQRLKSKEELTELFKKANVDLSKPTIYTCQGGITASTLAFIADMLGQKDFALYVGAFIEWQKRAPAELIIKGESK